MKIKLVIVLAQILQFLGLSSKSTDYNGTMHAAKFIAFKKFSKI